MGTTLTKVKGEVKIKSEDGKTHTAKEGEKLKKGDTVMTGKSSSAEVKRDDGTITKVGSRTSHTIINKGDKPPHHNTPGAVTSPEG